LTKVLLAEDSRFLRSAATTVLEAYGFKVFGAADGEQALKIASDENPDVVLLDLILPKVQGHEVLQRLRQMPAMAGVPVIIFTSHPNKQAFSAFAPVDFISKDSFVLDQLAGRINENLQKCAATSAV